MIPTVVYSHWIWAALMFLAFYAVYRKHQQSGNEMLENFYRFFLVWSVTFFGLMATMFAAGIYFEMPAVLDLGYVIPHVFAFVSVGYLWKVQSSINFPEYENLFWVFVAYGVALGFYGVMNTPDVAVVENGLTYGKSMFNMLIPLGMTAGAVLIAGSSFYSAYLTSGATRKKLAVIGVGTVLSLVVASMLHNFGYTVLGELTNLVWIGLFLSVAYWSNLAERFRFMR